MFFWLFYWSLCGVGSVVERGVFVGGRWRCLGFLVCVEVGESERWFCWFVCAIAGGWLEVWCWCFLCCLCVVWLLWVLVFVVWVFLWQECEWSWCCCWLLCGLWAFVEECVVVWWFGLVGAGWVSSGEGEVSCCFGLGVGVVELCGLAGCFGCVFEECEWFVWFWLGCGGWLLGGFGLLCRCLGSGFSEWCFEELKWFGVVSGFVRVPVLVRERICLWWLGWSWGGWLEPLFEVC